MRTDYTLEIYVMDRRTKAGQRLHGKYDYKDVETKWMQEEMRELQNTLYPQPKYRLELHETWVTRRNLMGGAEFKERYDTPYYCSPSSESYWSA